MYPAKHFTSELRHNDVTFCDILFWLGGKKVVSTPNNIAVINSAISQNDTQQQHDIIQNVTFIFWHGEVVTTHMRTSQLCCKMMRYRSQQVHSTHVIREGF